MNFEEASMEYLRLREEVAAIEADAKAQVQALKQSMAEIEAEITEAAEAAGLETIKTKVGTAYWSVHSNASVANPSAFMDYVRKKKAWSLMEVRASRTAVKAFVEEHQEPPPGVNFSSVKIFNLRRNSSAE